MRLLYYINLFLFSISMISTIYTRYAVLRRLKIKHCDLFFLLFLKKRAIIVFERKKRKVVMTMSIFRSKIGYWRGLLIIINHKRGNISFYEKPDILILQLGRCAVVRCFGGRVWVGNCWRWQSFSSIAPRSGCKACFGCKSKIGNFSGLWEPRKDEKLTASNFNWVWKQKID